MWFNLQSENRRGRPNLPAAGKARAVALDANGKPVSHDGPHVHATPCKKGTAVDMYSDGLSYRWTAENVGQYFGRETHPITVYLGLGN